MKIPKLNFLPRLPFLAALIAGVALSLVAQVAAHLIAPSILVPPVFDQLETLTSEHFILRSVSTGIMLTWLLWRPWENR